MSESTSTRAGHDGSEVARNLGEHLARQLREEETGEIVELLDDWGLTDPASVVLDIGCGIGRLEAALAPRVASVTGIDISQAMIEEARRRCGALPNVRFALASGSDLAAIPHASIDLVVLIDTLPHVILSARSLAEKLCAEAARVLAPSGSLLILNASYRGDPDAELAELAQLAESASLEIRRADWRPLGSGDAAAFQLKRAVRLHA